MKRLWHCRNIQNEEQKRPEILPLNGFNMGGSGRTPAETSVIGGFGAT
jgi:hypothetical protein